MLTYLFSFQGQDLFFMSTFKKTIGVTHEHRGDVWPVIATLDKKSGS